MNLEKRLNEFRTLALEEYQISKGSCEYEDCIEIVKCSILAKLKKLPVINGTHKVWKLRNPNIKMDLTPRQLNRKRREFEKDLTKPQIQYIKEHLLECNESINVMLRKMSEKKDISHKITSKKENDTMASEKMNNTPNKLSNNDNQCEGVIPTVVSFENDSDMNDASLEPTSLEKKYHNYANQ